MITDNVRTKMKKIHTQFDCKKKRPENQKIKSQTFLKIHDANTSYKITVHAMYQGDT